METSIGGSRYFLKFIDDHSRKTGYRIKTLRTDNGLEYINKDLKEMLITSGIRHQLTIRYTPKQNGVAERANRSIVERARSMLFEAELPKPYWAEAVATAAYLINRSPNSRIRYEILEELWTGEKQNLSHLRIFGCKAIAHVSKKLRQKFDSKKEELMFVGYCENSKGYRLIDPRTKKIVKSRDVVFLEEFKDSKTKEPNHIQLLDEENESDMEKDDDSSDTAAIKRDDEEETISDYSDCVEENESKQLVETQSNLPRKSTRVPKPVSRDDFYMYLTKESIAEVPETVEEALVSPDSKQWIKAMEEEYDSLVANNTWTTVDLPIGQKTLNTKWV
ncbi:retrovirus-related pol polyprotein from transposon tnt 1-94, partial [Lasius niger]